MPSGTGYTTVDFGAGASMVKVDVSVPAIAGGQFVEAWIVPADTVNNTADNHWVEDLTVMAGPAVAGVGFTLYARCNKLKAHGVYNVAYVYA